MASLGYTHGNVVTYRNLVNVEQVVISDRRPSGQATVQTPALATFDAFDKAFESGTGPLQLIHGTAAGHIIQIDQPKVQILNASYGDSDGVSMLNLDLSPIPSAVGGDDEISLTIK